MNLIRQKRQKFGWTIRELAEKVGSDISSISHWENEKKDPRPTKKRKLAEVLGCSLEELFPDLRESPPRTPAVFPDWFLVAWNQRSLLTLVGWLDVSRLRPGALGRAGAEGVVINEFLVQDSPLDLIVVPFEEIREAPAMFYKSPGGDWMETPYFLDFEKSMQAIFQEKGILRNDVTFWHHERGICLQPAAGRENRFKEIVSKLMTDKPNAKREVVDLRL